MEWGLREQRVNDTGHLIEPTYKPGLFKTLSEFYRFPEDESNSSINLFIARTLSKVFDCKTTIDGYRYCRFDQIPDYSLLLENDKAYLIGDCYPEWHWTDNNELIKLPKIDIIEEIDLKPFKETYGDDGIEMASR